MATTMVIMQAVVIALLIALLATPKDKVMELSNIMNLKYKIVLVER